MPEPSHILVADDDADIRDLVTFKLTQAGYEVQACPDGAAAWAAMAQRPPRLALLDVMMPGMSGLDVLRKARETEATAQTPILLLTARSRDVDVEDGFAVGATDYIIKPFSPRELVHRVAAVLGR